MNDADIDLDLERHLRAHFRDARVEDPTPSALRAAVLAIPSVAVLDAARRRRFRGLTLLAATIALGVGAAGWALLAGAPTPAKPRPFPPAVAVVPTSSVVPSPSGDSAASPAPTADDIRPVVVTQGDGQGAGASWQAAGTLAVARYLHTATRLEDGRVLVTGGVGPDGTAIAAAELWDPATRTFSPAGSLSQARFAHTATLLHDGRVLIVGGSRSPDSSAAVDQVEIWDPATGAFEAGSTPIRAQALTATTLQDGRVLIVGGPVCQVQTVATPPGTLRRCPGDNLRATWIWNPDGTLVAGPELNDERGWHTATLLADGRVLIVGNPQWGIDTPEAAEVYDPDTNTFIRVGEPRHYIEGAQAATLLRDGRVLVTGGDSADPNVRPNWFGPLRSAETWDPASGTFSRASAMELERRAHQAALLPDGRVLVAGGTGVLPSDAIDPSTPQTEVWDAATDAFKAGPTMADPRAQFTLTTLLDGSLLAIGGDARYDPRHGVGHPLGTAEILDLAPTN